MIKVTSKERKKGMLVKYLILLKKGDNSYFQVLALRIFRVLSKNFCFWGGSSGGRGYSPTHQTRVGGWGRNFIFRSPEIQYTIIRCTNYLKCLGGERSFFHPHPPLERILLLLTQLKLIEQQLKDNSQSSKTDNSRAALPCRHLANNL